MFFLQFSSHKICIWCHSCWLFLLIKSQFWISLRKRTHLRKTLARECLIDKVYVKMLMEFHFFKMTNEAFFPKKIHGIFRVGNATFYITRNEYWLLGVSIWILRCFLILYCILSKKHDIKTKLYLSLYNLQYWHHI